MPWKENRAAELGSHLLKYIWETPPKMLVQIESNNRRGEGQDLTSARFGLCFVPSKYFGVLSVLSGDMQLLVHQHKAQRM